MRVSVTGVVAALLLSVAAPGLAQTAGQSGQTDQTSPAQAAGQPAATGVAGDQTATEQPAAAETEPAPAEAEATGTGQEPADPADQAIEEKGYALGDIVLGDPDAPLTVIEYASFTCPHCGSFAENTFPQVKEDYIDTGKVKFILREVYFDQYGLWASMVARCGGEKGFYPLADTFLTTQETWTRAPEIGHAIQQVGRRAGLTAERLEQCLSDRDFAKALLAEYQRNAGVDEVTSTPTFIIDGEMHKGDMSYEEFSALLDAQL